ncbi:Cullin repeat-like-containing domain-containing protein [Cynara cardunculus var. scolymus]|uniref:Exocyst complex component SEC5 n=1 Tax=Cynara cardunculus var. scolymus TaxID=59895 RepID=A0A103XCC0_CYNCS|nr:Cullin repeat-like-containing domain-containing protein [Cynara cardunculus var. scolymus]
MSDSDDDELLQMALKEQSQRDVNYTRPSQSRSSKPVVNFVQPPSNHRSAKNPNPMTTTKSQHRRNATEDDEDSEVEMLSISSGDEDSVNDRKVGARNRARGTGRGGGKDDDKLWVGEEPDSWKRVDETELGRRVREMRETRTIPTTQKFEKKPSVAIKGLNKLQSFPRGMDCVDPLGLGVIDNKTLRLINEYTASSPSKSDKVDSDVRVMTMVYPTDIESKLRRIEEDPEGCGTSHLYSSIQGVTLVANRAFAPLLERQAQAEKIRSVQGMLQRFRTLFNLPSAIRGNINKGEYDLAVREYRKAKSIVLPSHVGILKRVLEEVEKVMHEFKGMLYRSMEDPQIDLTNLENVVRLLLELEPESDPIRHYLNIQNHRIRGLLEKCTFDHETRIENLQNELREKALSDEKWRKIQHELNESGDVDMPLPHMNNSLTVDSQPRDSGAEELDALRGRYIRRLTAVLVHHIPAFWKVALSVSSGKFAKSSQVTAELNITTSVTKTEEKMGDNKYSSHSLDEVSGMIQNTISAYESKVHNTFLDLEESNILQPYMNDAITAISKACEAFEAKEAAPSIAVAALRTLQYDITKIYIQRLSSWMRASTEEISKHESWIPVSVLERNKSSYTISHLPLAFRSVMATAMDQIDIVSAMIMQKERSKLAALHTNQDDHLKWELTCFDQVKRAKSVHANPLGRQRSRMSMSGAPVVVVSPVQLVCGWQQPLAVDGWEAYYCCRMNSSSRASKLTMSTEEDYHPWLRMMQSLGSEATKSEDAFMLLQETQESVRLSFLNCLLDFAGHLEQTGSKLSQNRSYKESPSFQNGYPLDLEENSFDPLPGSITHPHQQLLMVLSNLGFCKDDLSHEMHDKYKHIWMQTRVKDDEDNDMEDLVRSFSGLEEKVLAQYTIAKVTAAVNYLLDAGVQWGGAPAVKGVRDASVELLHTLVAVHAEVSAGCKPLLDKILRVLVEGLIDTLLSLFHEHKDTDIRILDANGFCQLMLELEYLETILNQYFTPDAGESLKSLQGVILEKATESSSEASDTPKHRRRATRGSDDLLADDGVSPDELIALAQQCSSELLESELNRTRINTACFGDSLPLDSTAAKAGAGYGSFRDSPSRNYGGKQGVGVGVGPPSFSRQKRR